MLVAPPLTDVPDAELLIGPVAHGGHCVARLDGRVVFVRHALPGERVVARFTEAGEGARMWRADAVRVLEPSPDRVPAAWPEAGPGGVGGGELSHVALAAQRRWKADVIAEQLRRLAKLDRQVEVEGVAGDDERGGLGYRTRIDLVADADGRAGMYRHRSHEVLAVDTMPLATDEVLALAAREEVFTRRWAPGTRIQVVVPAAGSSAATVGEPAVPAQETRGVVLAGGAPWQAGRPDRRSNARRSVTETVTLPDRAGGGEARFRVAADGFWQVHRDAPRVLVDAVLTGVGDVAGERVLDLYSGAGLFTVPLARAVGARGAVVAVEAEERAVRDARRALHDQPQAELHVGAVGRALDTGVGAGAGVVVLDPPRKGAGRGVVAQIAALDPRRIVYVACDPAALARDIAFFAEHDYVPGSLRAFDLFPHTHHVECVAVLNRGGGHG